MHNVFMDEQEYDLISDYNINNEGDSWREFQLNKFSESDQKYLNDILLNNKILNKEANDINKEIVELNKKLKELQDKMIKNTAEYRKKIYPECNNCGCPSYSSYCGRDCN